MNGLPAAAPPCDQRLRQGIRAGVRREPGLPEGRRAGASCITECACTGGGAKASAAACPKQELIGPRWLDDSGTVLNCLAVRTMVVSLGGAATEAREPIAGLRFLVHRGLAPVRS